MSQMAGFDLVIEISKNTALELIKANAKLAGNSTNPPFELSVPISIIGSSGLAHLIVDSMSLDLAGDTDVMLTLNFSNGSVILESPVAVTVSLLDGFVTMTSTLELVTGQDTNTKVLSTDLGAAKVEITFSSPAQERISAALSGTKVDLALFTSTAQSALQGFMAKAGGDRQSRPPNSWLIQARTVLYRARHSTAYSCTIFLTRQSDCSGCFF